MPLNFPSAEPVDLRAAFDALSTEERLTALAAGVVSPVPYEARELARMLRNADVRIHKRHVTVAVVEQACGALQRRGVLFGLRAMDHVVAAQAWAPWLTLEARRVDLLERLWAAFQAERNTYYWHLWEQQAQRDTARLRYATVTGRFDLVSAKIKPENWAFLAQPGALVLLDSLPERYREMALRGCLSEAVNLAAAPDPVIAACRDYARDLEPYAADIALIRVLQGRFGEVETTFDQLTEAEQGSKRARVGRTAAGGLVAMLRGDDDTALQAIENAIAIEKEGTRKRTAFPDSVPFALSLLSLVRADTPAARSRLDALLTTGQRQRIAEPIVSAVAYAAELRAGAAAVREIDVGAGGSCLNALLDGWACCWSKLGRGSVPYVPPGTARTLGYYVGQLASYGFSWALAEFLAIVGCAGAPLDPRDGKSYAAAGRQAAAMHGQLGTRTLTTLVPGPVAEWEYGLKALEQFAYDTSTSPPRREKGSAREGQIRLVWDLVDIGDYLAVTPREQRGYRSGTWSKGRTRTLRWLATAADTAKFPHAQDRAAAAAAVRHGAGAGKPVPVEALLFELAGHPHVVDEAGDPVEVVRAEPELLIEQTATGLRAMLAPDYWEDDRFHAWMADARRCEVIRLTDAHRRLRTIIPLGGLDLPAGARARLLEAVSALVAVVRIHGGVEGGAGSARQVEADPEPRVRLEPYRGGVSAEVVVEPIGGSETRFMPGAGGTLVFAQLAGEAVQARRDPAAERAAAERLLEACPRLAAGVPGLWSVELPEAADALELLEQLDAAGARCLWPQGERFRIVTRADSGKLRLRIKTVEDWLQASAELRIDPQRTVDLKQLFAALDANPGSRFLELGAGEFVALTESFRRQLEDLQAVSSPAAGGAVRVAPVAAVALEELIDQAQLGADRQWRDLERRLREAREFEPEVPSTLQAELRPYQEVGFGWLARLSRWGAGACLADDMGLGKTVQVLALLLERAAGGPALVVAPTSVVANWLDEARRFAPTLNAVPYVGPDRAALLAGEPGPFDLVVTTYTLLHLDAERLASVRWHSAVLDEAQAIKNRNTKRARAARALRAGFRAVTTGTPIQNHVSDLHSLFSFINPGLLGSAQQFSRNFARAAEGNTDGAVQARTRLRRLVAPFILRRLKSEVLDDLPARTEITLHVEMSPAEASFYEALRRRAMEDLEALAAAGPPAGGDGRLEILAHLTRLRRACCNPALVRPEGAPASSKLAVFGETLAELLANRHKVLVFSQFVSHLKLIETWLRKEGIGYQYLDGSTAVGARRERIAAFQAGQGDVFLISLTAGGVGLNLTAADYVIHMDPWWNPAVEDQASDRAHRIGQTRPVTIYRLVTKGTIEEQIVDLHHHKRDLADRLLEAGDTPARLDPAELLALLRHPPA